MRRDDDQLPPLLRRAVEVLREEPEIRPEWMSEVVHAAATDRHEAVGARNGRWSFRPSMAIAAGLAFAAAGAGVTYFAMRQVPTTASQAHALAARDKASVRFALVAPNAVNVMLVGDFNEWNPTSLPMKRSANGETWEVEVGLAPGRYTYAFVVDGQIARDPAAAQSAHDDFGAPSSVLLVKGGS
jgi:hypothetical protein